MGLPEIGDALQAQCYDLHRCPSSLAAEHLATNFAGAQRACLRLAEMIRSEGIGDGQ
jgi:hypothetical protein